MIWRGKKLIVPKQQKVYEKSHNINKIQLFSLLKGGSLHFPPNCSVAAMYIIILFLLLHSYKIKAVC